MFVPMSMTPWFTVRCYPALVAGDEYTPEMLAMLERQRAYFASDQLVRDRVEPWRGATPEECLEATIESCKEVELLFAMMEPQVRERAMQPEPLSPQVVAILEAMQR